MSMVIICRYDIDSQSADLSKHVSYYQLNLAVFSLLTGALF